MSTAAGSTPNDREPNGPGPKPGQSGPADRD